MSRVFRDTNLYIYLFEDYGKLSALAVSLRSKMLQRADPSYRTPEYSTWTYRPSLALKSRYQPG
jgi:hypothetical protein